MSKELEQRDQSLTVNQPDQFDVHGDLEYGTYEEMILRHAPNVLMGLSLVEHGYQVDVWERKSKDGSKNSNGGDTSLRKNEVNTYRCTTECRDFGSDHKIPELTEEFTQRLWDLIEEFRTGK